MSSTERRSIDNAIWLCQNCAKLVDSDTRAHTPASLLVWKRSAEDLALRQISESQSSIPMAVGVDANSAAYLEEVVTLGVNNEFVGESSDVRNLATRCAIAAIQRTPVKFDVRLAPTVLTTDSQDPLLLPRYEQARQLLATRLSRCLDMLASPSVYSWWQHNLQRVDDWVVVIEALLARSVLKPYTFTGHKLDVWRTDPPEHFAAIYLDPQELESALNYLGLARVEYLRFGAHWKAASDLPPDVILRHVIPRLLSDMEMHGIAPEGSFLNLMEWHIGDG